MPIGLCGRIIGPLYGIVGILGGFIPGRNDWGIPGRGIPCGGLIE